MKPIVLIAPPTDRDGKIRLTPKELKSYIEQAYEQGYADGCRQQTWITSDPTPVTKPYITWDWTKMTCGKPDMESIFTNAEFSNCTEKNFK